MNDISYAITCSSIQTAINHDIDKRLRDLIIHNVSKSYNFGSTTITIDTVFEYIKECNYEVLAKYITVANILGWNAISTIIVNHMRTFKLANK